MSTLKVNELDTKSGTVITVAAGKTLNVTLADDAIAAAQLATDSVTADAIAANAVDTSEIAANAVTLAEMAGLARGKIIVGDASGDPSALTVGSVNQVLKSDGTDVSWGADSGGLFASYAFIVDQKTQNTGGGTFTLGAWRTRDLNTEITDPDGIVSIAANEFTLAAGSYLIKWSAPAHMVNGNQTRLYDVTGAASVQVGSSAYTYVNHPTYTYEGPSSGVARVTPGSSNVYRIEHYSLGTLATNGFGLPSNIDVEIYTRVEIYKES